MWIFIEKSHLCVFGGFKKVSITYAKLKLKTPKNHQTQTQIFKIHETQTQVFKIHETQTQPRFETPNSKNLNSLSLAQPWAQVPQN